MSEQASLQVDVNPDMVRDQIASYKQEITAMYREMLPWVALSAEMGDLGGAASSFVTNKAEMATWAAVWQQWENDEVMEDEAPLDPGWWRSILEAKDPDEALFAAMDEQLSKREIRRRFGKAAIQRKRLRIPIKLTEWRNGLIRGQAPLDTQPPELGEDGLIATLEINDGTKAD